jgi:aspartate-semialdehyde dehydrogenase
MVAASVSAALARFRPARLAMVFLRPVSERGQEGIDELERQTVKLLSFAPLPDGIFDAQVAFNLLDAYGPAGQPSLADVRRATARDVARVLGQKIAPPAIAVIQAPVFFSYAFSIYADFDAPIDATEIERALAAAGLAVSSPEDPRPTNMSVTGRPEAAIGRLAPEAGHANGFWLWGAADNVRMVAANAVAMAESDA